MEDGDAGRTAGGIIRKRREVKGWSQKQLAAETLVAVRTIIRAEQGRSLKHENFLAICSVLDIDPASLSEPVPEAETVSAVDEAPDPSLRRTGRLPWPAFVGTTVLRRLAVLALLAGAGVLSANAGIRSLYGERPGYGDDVLALGDLIQARMLASRINYVIQDRAGRPNIVPAATVADWIVERQGPVSHCEGGCIADLLRDSSTYEDSDGTFRMAMGPMSHRLLRSAATMVSRRPGVEVRFAVTPRRGYPYGGAGLLWFDPRGIAPSQIPFFEDRTSYLQVEIRAEGATR